jgi:hypothetical protein
MARQLSKPAGSQASIPEKTAEAVGERVGDAYADPGSGAARNPPGKIARLALPHGRFSGNGAADPILGAVRQVVQVVSHQFDEQPFIMVGRQLRPGLHDPAIASRPPVTYREPIGSEEAESISARLRSMPAGPAWCYSPAHVRALLPHSRRG